MHYLGMIRARRPFLRPFSLRIPLNEARFRSSSSTQSPVAGKTTPVPEDFVQQLPRPRFYLDTGYALYAKRPSRPFPPPFLSAPSFSFSDPLTKQYKSRNRTPFINGQMIMGVTNGDDAVLAEETFIGANDGVGAWASREKGHAALWSRLILHFWALEAGQSRSKLSEDGQAITPNPVEYLQRAFEKTVAATSSPNEWNGTTTACAALLHSTQQEGALLYVTNLGDSQCLVIRPRESKVVFKTQEQWHWFDCPRQLGTNSPDIPNVNAVMERVAIQVDDIILTMTDGVVDNLWEHEIVESVIQSLAKFAADTEQSSETGLAGQEVTSAMPLVAAELVKAARTVAEDPYAESPFMERAVDEGLAMEGGKLDDISVVAAVCKERPG